MNIGRAATRALVTAATCAGLVSLGPADALKPTKERYVDSYAFVAEDYCGLADQVEIAGTVTGVLTIFNRRGLDYYMDDFVVRETHTLGENTVSLVSKPKFRDLRIEDLGDTLRITVLGSGPESTYGPDGKAISRNPGQFRFQITVDEETGEEIDGSFTVVKESTGRTDDFCARVLPVLQA